MATSKITNNNLFTENKSLNVGSVSSRGTATARVDVSKDNAIPIGIVGWVGSQTSYAIPCELYINNSNQAVAYVRNYGESTISGLSYWLTVLYKSVGGGS